MLYIDDKPAPSIALRETASSIDASLQTLRRYLSERAATHPDKNLQQRLAQTLFDLGTLGLQRENETVIQSWTSKAVCPIRLYHSLIVIGPLYRPGQIHGPCPRCLELRWLATRSKEEQQALLQLKEKAVVGQNPRITPFVLESFWTAVEILLRQQDPEAELTKVYDHCYALDLETLGIDRYQLIADSFCSVCAEPREDTRDEADIQLMARQKSAPDEYRLVKPLDYVLPETGYINPVCGMLGASTVQEYLHTVTSPVSGRFSIKTSYAVFETWWGGHGNSYDISQRLGLLEGLERYTGHRIRAKKVVIYDSYKNLASDALNPEDGGMYDDEFYQRVGYPYTRFRPDLKMHWVWGYSFRQKRPLLVPEQLAYYMHYRPGEPQFVQDCSNGCATGSSLEEAILYGLLELVERDGFLMTWNAMLSPQRIDPWSCHNRHTLSILDRLQRQGYTIYLLDTRMDVQIPSVTAIGVRRDGGMGNMLLAAGAGLDPEDAIRSALCEVAAYMPGFQSRLEKNWELVQEIAQDYRKVTALQHHPLAYGNPEMAAKASFLYQNTLMRSVDDLYANWFHARPHTNDLRDDLVYCLEDIFRLGMDVVAVNQTCPELENVGLKAASVIVPGLIPIDFGWGKNRAKQLPRLRTVPRLAGYRTDDFDVTYSNVMPHPFP